MLKKISLNLVLGLVLVSVNLNINAMSGLEDGNSFGLPYGAPTLARHGSSDTAVSVIYGDGYCSASSACGSATYGAGSACDSGSACSDLGTTAERLMAAGLTADDATRVTEREESKAAVPELESKDGTEVAGTHSRVDLSNAPVSITGDGARAMFAAMIPDRLERTSGQAPRRVQFLMPTGSASATASVPADNITSGAVRITSSSIDNALRMLSSVGLSDSGLGGATGASLVAVSDVSTDGSGSDSDLESVF